MTLYEIDLLNSINEKILFRLAKGINTQYLIDQIDDIICYLPPGASNELFLELYRIVDNLELGSIENNLF